MPFFSSRHPWVELGRNAEFVEPQALSPPSIDQYQLEVEHFSSCIRMHKEPIARLSETLDNIATIEAIYQAANHDWPIV